MHVLGLQKEEIFCKYIAEIAFFSLFHLKLGVISTLLLPDPGSPDHIMLPCKIKNRKAALGCEVLRKKIFWQAVTQVEECSLGKGQEIFGATGLEGDFLKMRAARESDEVLVEIQGLRMVSVLCNLYIHHLFLDVSFKVRSNFVGSPLSFFSCRVIESRLEKISKIT